MKVFVAGATGAVGRRLVPMLLEAGHEVTGMTRSEEKAAGLRRSGAEGVVCDAFDREGVVAAVRAAEPEVVVHQLTDIPPALNPRKYGEQMAGNDRLRREGTPNLIEAARAAGARRIVAQSISFAYRYDGARIKTEDDPLWTDAPMPFGRSVRVLQELESGILSVEGLEGVVQRYGYFCGPGTALAADGSFGVQARKRQLPVVGSGEGIFSFCHVDDAAAANVAALEGPTGIFNIVDDEPVPTREWIPAYAEALGAKPPRKVPAWLARIAAGSLAVGFMAEQPGAANAKAKSELGWAPRYPTYREVFAEL